MSLICIKCKATNIDEARFCKNCGANIAEEFKKKYEHQNEEELNRKKQQQIENDNIANIHENENNIIYNIAWIFFFTASLIFIIVVYSYNKEQNHNIDAQETLSTQYGNKVSEENLSSSTTNDQTNNIEQVNSLKVLIQDHIANIGGNDSGEYIKFQNDLAEIIIYTVLDGGGGNNYEQFMVSKINDVIYQPIYIGGKGVFMADKIRFKDGEIIINGMANKEDDAFGFPTLPYIKRFSIKGSIIIEQNNAT